MLPSAAGTTRALGRLWAALPERLTGSTAAQRVRKSALTRFRGAPPAEQRVIRTLGQLDDEIASLELAARSSDDDLRRGFDSFRMEIDEAPPADPFSISYRRWVMDLYEWLHGAPYGSTNEITPFDHDAALARPFPYLTANAGVVGDYLMAVGHAIRTAALGPGSRVLELGPGWGNVALPLAQLGCDVTTLDVSPQFAALIDARAERAGVSVNNLIGSYSDVSRVGSGFDAVIFFESFHHSDDHLRLLEDLRDIVAPGGRVLFAAEPITDRFWAPWGPRLDGESLWAIRRNGWLELGFRRSYFDLALRRSGWRSERVDCRATRWGEITVARRL